MVLACAWIWIGWTTHPSAVMMDYTVHTVCVCVCACCRDEAKQFVEHVEQEVLPQILKTRDWEQHKVSSQSEQIPLLSALVVCVSCACAKNRMVSRLAKLRLVLLWLLGHLHAGLLPFCMRQWSPACAA
eukprot:4291899-Amphidinium_carterae.1